MTYVSTDEGWLYVAAFKDVFTENIVGLAMERDTRTELVSKALWTAVKQERPDPGLSHHSDRGSQGTSLECRHQRTQLGMRASTSRRANCYDHAPMQSFSASWKQEQVHHHHPTRAEARAAIFDYIATFYNPIRRHSALSNRFHSVIRKSSRVRGG